MHFCVTTDNRPYLLDGLDEHGECGEGEDEVEEELDHGGDVHRLLVQDQAA